jgi:hypothetical protein
MGCTMSVEQDIVLSFFLFKVLFIVYAAYVLSRIINKKGVSLLSSCRFLLIGLFILFVIMKMFGMCHNGCSTSCQAYPIYSVLRYINLFLEFVVLLMLVYVGRKQYKKQNLKVR